MKSVMRVASLGVAVSIVGFLGIFFHGQDFAEGGTPEYGRLTKLMLRHRIWSSHGKFEIYLTDFKDKAGGRYIYGVSATKSHGRFDAEFYPIQYPHLREGDVIPVYGWFYRVGSIGDGVWVDFHWVKDQDIPMESRVQRTSLIVPYQRSWADCYMRSTDTTFLTAWKIFDRPNQERSATLFIRQKIGDMLWSMESAEVRKGDVLVLGDERVRVLNIVPRDDEKTRVIGWVELDTTRVSDADFAKAKSIVRPKTLNKDDIPTGN